MKRIKRMASLLLAMTMVLAMSVTVFAEGTNTIEVTNAKEGETYKIYKMLDLAVHDNAGANAEEKPYDGFSYTLNEKWNDFWKNGAGKDYIQTNQVGDKTYVVWRSDKNTTDDWEAFGKAAAKWAEDTKITTDADDITVSEDGRALFEGLANGYYMITSTYGTAVIVESTPRNSTEKITEKNNDNTTEKEVLEAAERNGSGNSWGESNDAAIGDTVEFRSKVSIAKNSVKVVYHDTMSAGLSFSGASSVKVYTDEACEHEFATENYDVVVSEIGQDTFQVRFKDTYVATLKEASTDLYIKYTAVLNNNAKVENPETNTAQVTWGNNGESTKVTTNTSTHSFQILKYDGTDTDKNPLADAKFELYTAAEGGTALRLAVSGDGVTYRVVDSESDELPEGYTLTADNKIVTLASGVITVVGVDSDDYYLEETDAPMGYNKLEGRKKVEVNENNSLLSEVENLSGSLLPSTGGIGTTIFYTVGGILVLGAGILLVAKKRMSAR